MTAGHSYGEFVALAAAGAIGPDQLLRLSEARGRFMKEAAAAEAGAMVAVEAEPGALGALLEGGGVVTANLNSPRQTVLSGPREHVEAALEWCQEREIGARMLPVACAFHSPHVAGAQQRLAALLAEEPVASPRIPVYSNTTGDAHGQQPEEIAQRLSEHLIRPVEFVREIEAMYRDGARLFVEVGPRSVLTGLVPQILGEREHVAVAVERSGRPGLASLAHALAALAAEGVDVQLDRMFRGRERRRRSQGPGSRAARGLLADRRRQRLARGSAAPPVRTDLSNRHRGAHSRDHDEHERRRLTPRRHPRAASGLRSAGPLAATGDGGSRSRRRGPRTRRHRRSGV